jgi:hypothetical protein
VSGPRCTHTMHAAPLLPLHLVQSRPPKAAMTCDGLIQPLFSLHPPPLPPQASTSIPLPPHQTPSPASSVTKGSPTGIRRMTLPRSTYKSAPSALGPCSSVSQLPITMEGLVLSRLLESALFNFEFLHSVQSQAPILSPSFVTRPGESASRNFWPRRKEMVAA